MKKPSAVNIKIYEQQMKFLLVQKEIINMANYHLNVCNKSRGKGESFIREISYITGKTLHDNYYNTTWYNYKDNVLYWEIILPDDSPPNFDDIQNLCYEIDKAETRKDARTARVIVGSLPNELPLKEQIMIVEEFVKKNFTTFGLGAIVAIHEGKNERKPSKNNPHVHIVITTRSIDSNGFCHKKDRNWNDRKYVTIWREQWAEIQNKAYKRNHIKAEVSPYSLNVQGYKRKALPHLSFSDYQKEKRGIHTIAGDERRKIKKHNKKLNKKQKKEKHRNKDIDHEIEM